MRKGTLLAFLVAVAAVCLAQGDHVPAYNQGPLKPGEAAPILSADELPAGFQNPYQKRAYEVAATIPDVLNQMPCYCYCERIGHKSLHTCFETPHGAHCGICMKEAFYAYQQNQLKKSPTEIRAGIIRGDWQAIDLEKAAKSD